MDIISNMKNPLDYNDLESTEIINEMSVTTNHEEAMNIEAQEENYNNVKEVEEGRICCY